MKLEPSESEKFRNALKEFETRPMEIPFNSFMIFDGEKPLALLCIYFEAGVAFVHGLHRPKNCSIREFAKSFDLIEKTLVDASKKVSLIFFTSLKSLQRKLKKHEMTEEKTRLYYYEYRRT